MKAVRIHEYGGPEVLKIDEVPVPEAGAGEQLARVHASSVNPIEWKIRQGYIRQYINYEMPLTLGWDLSGVVEKLGSNVKAVSIGDAIFARANMMRNGVQSEYAAVSVSDLAKKPHNLDHIQSAALPVVGLTALKALFGASMMNLSAGQSVLIHGAAGGVGTMAVQLAKYKGAKVYATASAGNLEFLRSLGADVVIDYHNQRFEDIVVDVDGVLDTMGGETQARSWTTLKQGGVLVSLHGVPSAELAAKHGVKASGVMMAPNRLEELASIVENGSVRPVIAEVLPLTEVRRAHELSQSGHVRGKIVLRAV